MKYGFDLHGVLDTRTKELKPMCEALVKCGHEVHIITGSKHGTRVLNHIKKSKLIKGVHYTHFFSISDELISRGVIVNYKGQNPYFDNEIWNKVKGEYCKKENICFMLDDSKDYGQHFSTPYALFDNKK